MTGTIHNFDEGESESMSIEEYIEEGGSPNFASIMVREQDLLESGQLIDEVQHNSNIVKRAIDEGAFFGKIRVPFWFRQDDEEVNEAFDGEDSMQGLIEDYSEKAWRIIAKKQTGLSGDRWYTWSWTFVPKSLSQVLRAEAPKGEKERLDIEEAIYEVRKAKREKEEEAWEKADGWEEKLEQIEN